MTETHQLYPTAVPGAFLAASVEARLTQTIEQLSEHAAADDAQGASAGSDDLRNARIMVVDDEPLNIRVVQKYLRQFGYQQVYGITDPAQVVDSIRTEIPDVLLLDIMMPVVSGFDILRAIRQDARLTHMPILVLTAACDRETRLAVLELGATDFLAKPIDPSELEPRVRNALTAKKYHDQIHHYAKSLEQAVKERTADLEASRRELVLCLARAGEFRDTDTGHHAMRVGRCAGIIARATTCPAEFVEMLEQAAQLHDIGKIAIPDEILRHPGKLTPEDFERMQRHVLFGKRIIEPMAAAEAEAMRRHTAAGQSILSASKSPLIMMASRIALTHHERWDGNGYPLGLAAYDIPLEGRITAVADVFDALASKRPYKPAFPFERCCQIIVEEAGKHFDPEVVEAFMNKRHTIAAVQIELADPE